MRARRLTNVSVICAVAVSGVLLAPAAAVAKPSAPGKAQATVAASRWRPPALPPVRTSFTVEGTVAAVDADAATITIDRPGKGGLTTSATVAVDAAAVVTVNGLAVTLADVPTGARVRVSGTVTSGVAKAAKIQATTTWPFRVDSTVSAVDTDAATISAQGYDAVAVDSEAVVTVDGVVATLADVPVGARVRVSGTVTNSVPLAARVQATTTWPFRVDSTVQAVGADEVTVARYGVIPVDPAAKITLNRTVVTLDKLPVGARVRVSGIVTNGTPAANRIEATSPYRWSWRFGR